MFRTTALFMVPAPCLDIDTSNKIEKVENACIRLIFGIRKFEHISHKFGGLKWLRIKEGRLLNITCVSYKMGLVKQPPYLLINVSFRSDVHNLNLSNVGSVLTPPTHRTAIFER